MLREGDTQVDNGVWRRTGAFGPPTRVWDGFLDPGSRPGDIEPCSLDLCKRGEQADEEGIESEVESRDEHCRGHTRYSVLGYLDLGWAMGPRCAKQGDEEERLRRVFYIYYKKAAFIFSTNSGATKAELKNLNTLIHTSKLMGKYETNALKKKPCSSTTS